jgi:hypothetical protein
MVLLEVAAGAEWESLDAGPTAAPLWELLLTQYVLERAA